MSTTVKAILSSLLDRFTASRARAVNIADPALGWHGQDPWRTIATGHVVVQASDLRKVLDYLHSAELARMAPELDDYTPSTIWKHADAIESFLHASHQITGVTFGDYFNRYAQ